MPRSPRLPPPSLALAGCLAGLALAGCTAEPEKCLERRTPLRADEVPSTSYFIYSAQDVLDQVAGSYEAPSRTESGDPVSTISLTLEPEIHGVVLVESDANPEFEEREVVYCYDRIEIDVTARFASADGRFDEIWDGTLIASGPEPEFASFEYDFTNESLVGSFVPMLAAGESLRRIWVYASLGPDHFIGSILVDTIGGDETDPHELEQWDTEPPWD